MKKSFNLWSFSMVALMVLTLFAACKKENVTNPSTSGLFTQEARNINNSGHADSRGGENEDDCGCYDAFDGVDWEASEEEVIAQIEAILEQMSDAEVEALLTPVCTEDEIYDNACIAECEEATGFAPCTDEDFNDIFGDDDGFDGECDGYDDCFEINYPVDVQLPDGTTQTANDDEELETIFEDWYEQNPNDTLEPTLVYPIEVTLEDGTVATINNDDELDALLEECFGGWDDDCDEPPCNDDFDLCFDFVYPIEVILPDGTSQTANDGLELEEIIFTYYEQNPNDSLLPTLNYPVDVELEDGTIQTVNSDEELEALLESCDEGEPLDDCFTVNYPVTVVLPDGTTSDANSDEELETIIEDWFTQNPQSNDFPTFEYPISVTLDDGTVQDVNTDDELDVLFEDCFGFAGEVTDKLIMGGGKTGTIRVGVKAKN